MRLTMDERKTVTKALAEQYRRVGKKEKRQLLGQFAEATGYNRVYWSIVRRYAGYGRYESPETLACLNELYNSVMVFPP